MLTYTSSFHIDREMQIHLRKKMLLMSPVHLEIMWLSLGLEIVIIKDGGEKVEKATRLRGLQPSAYH